MKKLLSFALAALMVLVCVFSFTSCGKKGKTLDEVKKAGELVVATSPDFPPFENLEGGEVVYHCERLLCGEDLLLAGVGGVAVAARQVAGGGAVPHHDGLAVGARAVSEAVTFFDSPEI